MKEFLLEKEGDIFRLMAVFTETKPLKKAN